nr:uncharacterized protein LOC117273319 [Nicotiana tomentosiformis]
MAVIGPIEPAASNEHRFILLAIDYFTKWVEPSTYKVVTKNVVADFVRNNIVCKVGILESISTDNAANLYSDLMREICEKFRIIHRNSMLYKNIMGSAFNKRVKSLQFALGQLVLKKIFPHQEEAKVKFEPNWQGPYVVHRALSRGALILVEMDGNVSTKPINSDAIKRYYI